ncbi:hypothetical protein, partial [Pantoea sp. GbtcB22]|uniref:hypothetical protein n=1 Tax=Pantoea sp. GbtcB22 TaxID=2824767 RepID=UPI001C2F7AC8
MSEADKDFLRSILKQYEQFAALPGDEVEQRAIRAEGQARVGLIRYNLGEDKDAELSFHRAKSAYLELA